MLILTIRTDQPEAEIGLFEWHDKLAYETWQAHRQLADTIHRKIGDVLASQDSKKLQDIEAIVVFQGPGSFTGLRIGLSVANALAYGLKVPIIGSEDDDWIKAGITRLQAGQNDGTVAPHYGAPVHITQQRK